MKAMPGGTSPPSDRERRRGGIRRGYGATEMTNDELPPLEGGCSCRQVRYRMLTGPLFVHCCHCTWCQRESGAAFAINAMIEADRVVLLQGELHIVDTPSASGKGQRIARCRNCEVTPAPAPRSVSCAWARSTSRSGYRRTSISSLRRSSRGSWSRRTRRWWRNITGAKTTGRAPVSSAARRCWPLERAVRRRRIAIRRLWPIELHCGRTADNWGVSA